MNNSFLHYLVTLFLLLYFFYFYFFYFIFQELGSKIQYLQKITLLNQNQIKVKEQIYKKPSIQYTFQQSSQVLKKGINRFNQMGYKLEQTLTKSGSTRNKLKHPNTNTLISTNSSIYKKYKKMHQDLHSKYTTAKQSLSINSIMSRTHLGTKISSQQNRQLAMIDVDKLISLSLGIIKQNDQRIQAMRMAVDLASDNRMRNNFIFPRLVMGDNQGITRANIIEQRIRANQERLNDIMEYEQPREVINIQPRTVRVDQQNLMNENADIQLIRQNRPERNALGILRLVRAARLHYMRMSEQMNNLGQNITNQTSVLPPVQVQPSIQVQVLQMLNNQVLNQPQINIIPQNQPLTSRQRIQFTDQPQQH